MQNQTALFNAPAMAATLLSTVNPLEVIAHNLLDTTERVGLPKHYQQDLAYDLDLINKYNADFIWVLRENGTAIAPVMCGFLPTHVTYWLEGDSSAKAFLVSDNGQAITSISAAKATELINRPPKIDFNREREAIIKDVNNLLNPIKDTLGHTEHSNNYPRLWRVRLSLSRTQE